MKHSRMAPFWYVVMPPSRGRIFDTKGRLLAGNAEAYALNIVPKLTSDLYLPSELVTLDDDLIAELMERAESQPSFLPLTIRDDLTQREVARVVVRTQLPGVSFDRIEKRIYPQGLLTGLTGYVGRITKEDIEQSRAHPQLINMRNGKSGIEYAFEQDLRGKPGANRFWSML